MSLMALHDSSSRLLRTLVLWYFLMTILRFSNARLGKSSIDNNEESLSLSLSIPGFEYTMDMAHLSSLVYGFLSSRANNCTSFPTIYEDYINSHPEYSKYLDGVYTCHLYERDEQDTQVMVVSKENSKNPQQIGYIAVVYAGTDDFRTALTDADILTTQFGPEINGTHPMVPDSRIRVHMGFNNAVFRNDLFYRVQREILNIRHENSDKRFKIFTTGHSLGGADAILTAVALKLHPELQDEQIDSISFGCPKSGNWWWRDWVNSIDGLGIWRVVKGIDIVPRLPPGIRFHHAGHTLQLDFDRAKAYWLHDGDSSLGLRGIPLGWNTLPYVLAPAAAIEHVLSHYTKYLTQKSAPDKDTYYFSEFERVNGSTDDNIDDQLPKDDDIWNSPPGEDFDYERAIAAQIGLNYVHSVKPKGLQGIPSFDAYDYAEIQ